MFSPPPQSCTMASQGTGAASISTRQALSTKLRLAAAKGNQEVVSAVLAQSHPCHHSQRSQQRR